MADETDYTRTFIGARYVPVFADEQWNSSNVYEPLTMVSFNNKIYVSKQYVPNGIQLNDTNYWIEFTNTIDSSSESIITDSVNTWLDNHPEATTTVQDNSITDAKLVQSGGILETVDLIKAQNAATYYDYPYIVNGGINSRNNPTLNDVNTRLRTNTFVKLHKGNVVEINSDGLRCGVNLWRDSITTANCFRWDGGSNLSNIGDKVRITEDCFMLVVFKDDNDSVLDPTLFNGYIRIYDYDENKNFGLELDDLLYDRWVNNVDGYVNLQGSDRIDTGVYSIEENTIYNINTTGRIQTTKYITYTDDNDLILKVREFIVDTDDIEINFNDCSPAGATKLYVSAVSTYTGPSWKAQYIKVNKVNALFGNEHANIESLQKTFSTTFRNNYFGNNIPTFIHLTDIHGDHIRFNNAVNIANMINANGVLATGDFVPYYSYTEIPNILNCSKITPIIPCIGNHDSYDYNETQMISGFITPFDNSFVYDGASSSYFYKDLDDIKLRIISVNQFQYRGVNNHTTQRHYTSEQILFICNALNNCPDDYGIIILMHTPEHNVPQDITDPNKFYQFKSIYSNVAGTMKPIYEIVDAFISGSTINKTWNNYSGNTPATFSVNFDFSNKNNSEFICYVTGHLHRDSVYYVEGTINKQLMLNEVCTCAWSHRNNDLTPGSSYPYYTETSDLPRNENDETQNSFNIYGIDRDNKLIRIARIGSKVSCDMRIRDFMSISYKD